MDKDIPNLPEAPFPTWISPYPNPSEMTRAVVDAAPSATETSDVASAMDSMKKAVVAAKEIIVSAGAVESIDDFIVEAKDKRKEEDSTDEYEHTEPDDLKTLWAPLSWISGWDRDGGSRHSAENPRPTDWHMAITAYENFLRRIHTPSSAINVEKLAEKPETVAMMKTYAEAIASTELKGSRAVIVGLIQRLEGDRSFYYGVPGIKRVSTEIDRKYRRKTIKAMDKLSIDAGWNAVAYAGRFQKITTATEPFTFGFLTDTITLRTNMKTEDFSYAGDFTRYMWSKAVGSATHNPDLGLTTYAYVPFFDESVYEKSPWLSLDEKTPEERADTLQQLKNAIDKLRTNPDQGSMYSPRVTEAVTHPVRLYYEKVEDEYVDETRSDFWIKKNEEKEETRDTSSSSPETVSEVPANADGSDYYARKIQVGSATAIYDIDMIRKARESRVNVLLRGKPGTGKTALCYAALENLQVIECSASTEAADFIGSYVPTGADSFEWRHGPLTTAAMNGWPLLVDEIAMCDPRELPVLYAATDGRKTINVTANPEIGEVEIKDGFYVIAAYNPDVPGAVISDALLSRFPIQLEVTTDYDMLKNLGVESNIIIVARNLSKKAENNEILRAPQTRELLDYMRIYKLFGQDVALSNFIGSADASDVEIWKSVIESAFGTTVTPISV